MKRINIIILIQLLLLCACSDFLDKDPLSEPSENTFWKQKGDLDMAITSCYGTMTKFSSGYFAFATPLWDTFTDNCHSVEGRTFDVFQGNIDPSTSGITQDVYLDAYVAIARLNLFLERLEKYDKADVSKSDKEFYKGQVLFLRAFYYSFLYRCYGDVPLVLVPLDLNTQYQPKVNADKVLSQINSDLDIAINILPDKTYEELSGKVTKSAALALKMRLLLDDAYNDEGKADIQKMKKVIEVAEKIKGYSLSSSFEDIFQGGAQEKNPEIIFSTKYLAPNNWHTGDMWFGVWMYGYVLTNLANEFEFKDGTPFSTDNHLYNSKNPIENRDPRMGMSVFYKRLVMDGVEQPVSNDFPTGYGMKKFLTRDKNKYPLGYNTRSDQDWVHFRYAEVLLDIAEAENEVNGPIDKVYKIINMIRERKGINMPPLPEGLTQDQMRNKIRHERRIELAFEGHRYFDLKRWHIIEGVMKSFSESTLPLYKPVFEKRFYRWPLPQSEIDKSNGKLIQNPDYE